MDHQKLVQEARAGFAEVAVEPELKERALAHLTDWLTGEEFAAYRPQIEWLIRERQWAGLIDRFYQILPFGTGGRRGAVGIGPNRMNPWTLGASVQGHCEYLKERFPGVSPLTVVLGFDVRRFEDVRKQYHPALPNPLLGLTSRDFAGHAACVYAANGIWSLVIGHSSFGSGHSSSAADSPPVSPEQRTTDKGPRTADQEQRYMATPELSYAIRYFHAHGGLNISASHNPPDDNGGKFYDERGGQAVPPDDQIMADLVEQVSAIRSMSWHDAVRTGKVRFLDDAVHQAYIELNARQSLLGPAKPNEFTVVFTPLHGVGRFTVLELLEKQRFRVLPVAEQMTPDGLFPNCTSPNPEVPASMDRAIQTASSSPSAELIISTDPDADRLGAMAKARDGKWQYLTGNQIAALIAHFKLSQLSQQGLMPASPIVVTTEVTSRLIGRIARQFGCQVVDDLLVGFKYIGEVLWQLERDGRYGDVAGRPEDFLLGCEESHGILVTPHIRDKDAAGAALLLAELALYHRRRGFTVPEYLDQLHREFGYFHNTLQNLVMAGILGKQQMLDMLHSLRTDPPKAIAGIPVTGFEDLQREDGRLGPFKGDTDRIARNVLIFRLGDRARIILRPSGTEPKAKAYVEACSDACPPALGPDAWRRRCAEVDDLARRLSEEFVKEAKQRVRAG